MKIAFCTPFKSPSHPKISGDVTIARDLIATLKGYGHEVVGLDHFPAKEIYWQPRKWAGAKLALDRMTEQARGADCIFTYGTYYKVPDIFGPTIARRLKLPYFIFQASYAEKRGQKLATWPGFVLNRRAMRAANHIFCNRMNDVLGCRKLLPEHRFSYVKPGLPGGMFQRNEAARKRLLAEWDAGDTPVLMTAAMMRAGVKVKGLEWVIESCARLRDIGRDFTLVVIGDGPRRNYIEALAKAKLGNQVRFLGLVDRKELADVFSAGDLFAFPGLEESVGMVYLEAQECGLPVIATNDEGAPHVIRHEHSGLVTDVSINEFTDAIDRLIVDKDYRHELGKQAVEYVQRNHEAGASYSSMNKTMQSIVGQRKL